MGPSDVRTPNDAPLAPGPWRRPAARPQVKDDLGENASVRRALAFSFGLWSLTLVVQVLGIDDRWYGRALETGAIVAAVVCFFVLHTADAFGGRNAGERLSKLTEAFQLCVARAAGGWARTQRGLGARATEARRAHNPHPATPPPPPAAGTVQT